MYYYRFLMVAGLFLILSGTVLNQLPQHEPVTMKIDLLR